MKKYTKSIRKQMKRSERRRVRREEEKEKTRLYFQAHPERIPVKKDLTKRNSRGEEVFSIPSKEEIISPIEGIIQEEDTHIGMGEHVTKKGSFADEIEMIRRENEAKLKILTGESSPQMLKAGGKER